MTSLRDIDFEYNFLTSFDNNELPSVTALSIRGSLTNFANNNLSSVTYLDLTDNDIRSINNLRDF